MHQHVTASHRCAVLLLPCVSGHSDCTGVSMTPSVKLQHHSVVTPQKTHPNRKSVCNDSLSHGRDSWPGSTTTCPDHTDFLSVRCLPYVSIKHFRLHTYPLGVEGDQYSCLVILLPQRPVGTWCLVSCGQPVGSAVSDTRPWAWLTYRAPIVFRGWIGSRSVCHSASTRITRRHSGACFCLCFLLSCQPHRATLFCLWAHFTLISEFSKAPNLAP